MSRCQLAIEDYTNFSCPRTWLVMSLSGPRLPTWAMQQISSYLGRRAAKVIAKAALDPKRQTLEIYCHSGPTMRY
jgi:hypothetical protein